MDTTNYTDFCLMDLKKFRCFAKRLAMEVGHHRERTKMNDSDEEEVTETLIVGVTERGVLRKRSIKRKVTKEEKSKWRGYGNAKSDYDAIVSRILDDRIVKESIDTLQERLKMVVLMSGDCMELVSQLDTMQEEQTKKKLAFDLELFLIALAIVSLCIFAFWIRWFW